MRYLHRYPRRYPYPGTPLRKRRRRAPRCRSRGVRRGPPPPPKAPTYIGAVDWRPGDLATSIRVITRADPRVRASEAPYSASRGNHFSLLLLVKHYRCYLRRLPTHPAQECPARGRYCGDGVRRGPNSGPLAADTTRKRQAYPIIAQGRACPSRTCPSSRRACQHDLLYLHWEVGEVGVP